MYILSFQSVFFKLVYSLSLFLFSPFSLLFHTPAYIVPIPPSQIAFHFSRPVVLYVPSAGCFREIHRLLHWGRSDRLRAGRHRLRLHLALLPEPQLQEHQLRPDGVRVLHLRRRPSGRQYASEPRNRLLRVQLWFVLNYFNVLCFFTQTCIGIRMAIAEKCSLEKVKLIFIHLFFFPLNMVRWITDTLLVRCRHLLF